MLVPGWDLRAFLSASSRVWYEVQSLLTWEICGGKYVRNAALGSLC